MRNAGSIVQQFLFWNIADVSAESDDAWRHGDDKVTAVAAALELADVTTAFLFELWEFFGENKKAKLKE